MKKIRDFLGKFKDILFEDASVRDVARGAVLQVLGADVKTSDISIKKDTILISGSPSLKNEIFLNKNRLIEEINKKITPKICADIR